MTTTAPESNIEDVNTPMLPDSGDAGEGGKLKMIVALVKKCLGVKDIASMRLSLPASLLEPLSNLEYWHYLDRPDFLAALNDSDDPFLRMLAILRYQFTRYLRYVHQRAVKPYNSVLGEHFRAHWDVVPNVYVPDDSQKAEDHMISESASIRSGRSGVSSFSKPRSTSTTATSPPVSNTSSSNPEAIRVAYLTEQVSHHPPVSAHYTSCPARHVEMVGIDQLSAKVSGTTVRITPGQFHQGIFIRFTGGPGAGERYNITSPVAIINGILRGNPYVTFSDSTIITCEGGKPGHKFRAIFEYKEESWLGKAHFLLEGVIHTVLESDANHCAEWTKVKHVPQNRIVAVFDGSWRGKIRWRRVGLGSYPQYDHSSGVTRSTASSPSPSHVQLPVPQIPAASQSRAEFSAAGFGEDRSTLVDVNSLDIIPKVVRPLEKQHARESRKLWKGVTDSLTNKEYSDATREKVVIEQRQRDEAALRKKSGVEFIPRFFENKYDAGWAELTQEGKLALEEEIKEQDPFCVEDGVPLKA